MSSRALKLYPLYVRRDEFADVNDDDDEDEDDYRHGGRGGPRFAGRRSRRRDRLDTGRGEDVRPESRRAQGAEHDRAQGENVSVWRVYTTTRAGRGSVSLIRLGGGRGWLDSKTDRSTHLLRFLYAFCFFSILNTRFRVFNIRFGLVSQLYVVVKK